MAGMIPRCFVFSSLAILLCGLAAETARADRYFSADDEDVRAFAEALRAGQCSIECAFGDLAASALPAISERFGGEYVFYVLRSQSFGCGSAGCQTAVMAIGTSDIRYLAEKYALDPDTLDWENLARPQSIRAAPILMFTGDGEWYEALVPAGRLGEFRHGTYPSYGDRTHPGADIVADCGSEVRAWRDGEVVDAIASPGDPNFGSLGYMLLLRHAPMADGQPLQTIYLHLESPPKRTKGHVDAGEPIGEVGKTGFSIGCHLHFEVRHFEGRFHPVWANIYGAGDRRGEETFARDWSNPAGMPMGEPDQTAAAAGTRAGAEASTRAGGEIALRGTDLGGLQSEQAADEGPRSQCQNGFVEITGGEEGCGFRLGPDGTLSYQGDNLASPLIVTRSSDGNETAAAKVILFPASPSKRFRILQACDGTDERASLCWAVFGFDGDTRTLTPTTAGKYGPKRWIAWSEDEALAVLGDENEGVNWLHFVSSADFKSAPFPGYRDELSTIIDFSSFEWLSPRSARVRLVRCGPPDYCENAQVDLDGRWETLTVLSPLAIENRMRGANERREEPAIAPLQPVYAEDEEEFAEAIQEQLSPKCRLIEVTIPIQIELEPRQYRVGQKAIEGFFQDQKPLFEILSAGGLVHETMYVKSVPGYREFRTVVPQQNIKAVQYTLTEKGKEEKIRNYRGRGFKSLTHNTAFCYARPNIEEIIYYTPPEVDRQGRRLTQVSYRFEWELSRWAQKPSVARKIKLPKGGQDTMILMLTNKGWRAL